jgi:PucR C-terminal helix-turn-helix domain/GGDEF-like domain
VKTSPLLAAEPPEWIAQLRPVSIAKNDPPFQYEDEAELYEISGRMPWLWALERGDDVALRLAAMYPELSDAGQPLPVLRHGVRSGMVRVLLSLSTNTQRGLLTRENTSASREFVRLGVPLPDIQMAIHRGSEYFLDAFLEEIEKHAAVTDMPALMRGVVPIVMGAHEDFAPKMQERYLAEYARWASSVEAGRRELVNSLLAGQSVDIVDASATLNYPLSGKHVAYILAAEDSFSSGILQKVASDLLDRADGDSLAVPVGEKTMWIWLSPRRIDVLVAHAEQASGIRIASGQPLSGADGFRITHLQAEQAMRVSTMSVQTMGHVAYRDVELVALVTVNEELGVRFAYDALRELAKDGPEMREMRDTIFAYLEENGSLVHAAERLYVSRNTVAYRLSKAERILGHSVKARRAELLVAIKLLRVFGGSRPTPENKH